MKFSITIPAYKQKYLYEAIESCLAQTYKDFELIIVDDASPEDLKSVVHRFQDSRIRYYRNEKNCGALNVVDNWNLSLGYATGDYVICMGDDDKLLPNCLEEYFKLINRYPDIGLLHGWTEIINEDSIPTRLTCRRCEYESVYSLMWHRLNVYSNQFIGDFCFKSDLLKENGGFYKLPLAWSSDDLSAYIAASYNGVANTQAVVFQYRVNSQTISSTGNADSKMDASISYFNWIHNYISRPTANHEDEMFRKQLLNEFDKHFESKKAYTIAMDLKSHNILRFFYWLQNADRWSITVKCLLKAIKKAYL